MVNRRNKNRTRVTVKVGQLNAQNSRLAIDELRTVLAEKDIDTIALQEPYNKEGIISGLGVTTRVITDTKAFVRTTQNKNIKSAIAVRNPETKTLKLEHLCNSHFTCAEIERSTVRFYLISVYMQHSDPIGPYLQHLEKIVQALQDKEVVMCIDANATSASWNKLTTHNGISDSRGEELEQFIAQHRLIILNSSGKAPTFDNLHGQSNIDITIATTAIAKKIKNWNVHVDEINSDHRLITFEISRASYDPETKPNNRFNTKRADWQAYREHISELHLQTAPQLASNQLDAQTRSELIDKMILEAGNRSIPKKNVYSKSVPWWNRTLSDLRKKVFEARHRLQRTKDETARKRLLAKFRRIRNNYAIEIKKAKQESWGKFVAKEGNKNPWSIVYKLQTKRLKLETAQCNLNIDGTHTMSLEETAETLMNALIPNDDKTNETDWHRNMRNETEITEGTDDSPPFTLQEVADIVRTLNTKKAPGHDLIEAKMIKEAWPELQLEILELFNSCMMQMVFPTQYKKAQIRVLLKSEEKDRTDPKSYRPISLLPVTGKILERAIAGRLKELVNSHPLSSQRQYGFRPGRCTDDAIVELRRIVGSSRGKYAVGLLFDISGAFDNVWWPSILGNLKARGCPKNLYGLIQSYLSDRTANIIRARNTTERKITKGCPQGSVLGPIFWNLVFDEAIEVAGRNGNEPIAFADDLIVVVSADTRLGIETKANEVTRALLSWCAKQKLELSKSKSEMILLKGFLDIKRPPTVKIGDKSVKMKSKVRYLGIHFGTRFSIQPHIDYITEKTRKLFSGFVKLAKEHWGLNTRIIRTIYKGLVLPILCYAAAGWAEELNHHQHRRLKSAQRQSLLSITRAYRTTSNDALTVLAGEMPINILLKERIASYHLRKGTEFQLGELRYTPPGEGLGKEKLTHIRKQIREQTTKIWQTEWEATEKGRTTRSFFPCIKSRLQLTDRSISHRTAQLLTGHGRIRSTLHRLNLSDTELCRCGHPDTVEHIIFHCSEEEREREELRKEIGKHKIAWPCTMRELAQKETIEYLTKFAESVIKKRETLGD